ncbi:hypothetical protein SHXM_09830 [Streptomyces hygroscopicus]|nr:hypothetical protein SHXM_09830 [Streptomyces hygroscopicus]
MSHMKEHNEHPGRLGQLRGSPLRQTGMLAVVLAAALWGLGGTFAGKLFAQGADPLEAVAVRTWITLAGLAALLLARRSPPTSAQRERIPVPWRLVVGFGLSISVANAGLFLAIQRLPVAVALVLQNLAPALVVLSVLVSTRRAPSARVIAGLVAALAGVACVVELPTTSLGKIDLPGLGFGLLTAAGIAAFSYFGSHATRACGALTANTWAFVVASGAWLLFQSYRGMPELFHRPVLLVGAFVIGVFGTLVPFLLYAWGTARVGAQAGAVTISLEPLFGAVLAWAWLGQTITLVQTAGAAVLVTAVVFLQRSDSSKPTPAQHNPTD